MTYRSKYKLDVESQYGCRLFSKPELHIYISRGFRYLVAI